MDTLLSHLYFGKCVVETMKQTEFSDQIIGLDKKTEAPTLYI